MKFRTKKILEVGGIYEVNNKPYGASMFYYRGKVKILGLNAHKGTTRENCPWHHCQLLGPNNIGYNTICIAECYFL